ncbi:hypothetical protein [Bacillus cereus group sp. BfR-BA-01349]|uniref:hypothetical protein n=1 Tax=Bacillus cereus group sp. BfR-BA-01349 TaxID=2920312 RepID=UPI001F5A3BC8
MAKVKFEQDSLSKAAASVKRTILRRAKNGAYLDEKLNKTTILNKISASLNVTTRSLYSESRKNYLDEWFRKLLEAIEDENMNLLRESGLSSLEELKNHTIEELQEEIQELKKLIKAYQIKVQKNQVLIEDLLKNEVQRYERL